MTADENVIEDIKYEMAIEYYCYGESGRYKDLCEELLRRDLAWGKITYEQWVAGMDDLDAKANPKGVCGQCLDGLKVELNYGIICRIDNSVHHQWDTCLKFREDS